MLLLHTKNDIKSAINKPINILIEDESRSWLSRIGMLIASEDIEERITSTKKEK